MHEVHKEEFDGFTVKLFVDDDPLNPREEYDNVGKMVSFHNSRYGWGDEQLDRYARLGEESRRRVLPRYFRRFEDAAVFLWINLFEDWSPSLSVTEHAESADGFIYCTRKQVEDEWSGDVAAAERYLRAEVETASQYYSGDVYGYVVTDEGGDEGDSCWGFYGLDYAKQEARAALESAAYSARRDSFNAAMFEAVESMKIDRMMHV